MHALLVDRQTHSTVLDIPHKAPSQADRLRPALEERNLRMMGPGQELWNHACEKCTYVFAAEDGHLRKYINICELNKCQYV
jgi:predicted  nucleic acid-binding Zn-ribbon protein